MLSSVGAVPKLREGAATALTCWAAWLVGSAELVHSKVSQEGRNAAAAASASTTLRRPEDQSRSAEPSSDAPPRALGSSDPSFRGSAAESAIPAKETTPREKWGQVTDLFECDSVKPSRAGGVRGRCGGARISGRGAACLACLLPRGCGLGLPQGAPPWRSGLPRSFRGGGQSRFARWRRLQQSVEG